MNPAAWGGRGLDLLRRLPEVAQLTAISLGAPEPRTALQAVLPLLGGGGKAASKVGMPHSADALIAACCSWGRPLG